MSTLFIPNEEEIKKWVKEAVIEAMSQANLGPATQKSIEEEPLLKRKDIAALFQVSLVTLHSWMKQGLPSHKQRGRVFFLRSEVIQYVMKNKTEKEPQ